jgi:hypothetical protein
MWSYPHSACKFHYLPERIWSCQVSSLCLWKISTRSVDGPPLPSPRDLRGRPTTQTHTVGVYSRIDHYNTMTGSLGSPSGGNDRVRLRSEWKFGSSLLLAQAGLYPSGDQNAVRRHDGATVAPHPRRVHDTWHVARRNV